MRSDAATLHCDKKNPLSDRTMDSLSRGNFAAWLGTLNRLVSSEDRVQPQTTIRELIDYANQAGQYQLLAERVASIYCKRVSRSHCDLVNPTFVEIAQLHSEAVKPAFTSGTIFEANPLATAHVTEAFLGKTMAEWIESLRSRGIDSSELSNDSFSDPDADRTAIYLVQPHSGVGAGRKAGATGISFDDSHPALVRSHCDLAGIGGKSGPLCQVLHGMGRRLTDLHGSVVMGLQFEATDRTAIRSSSVVPHCLDIVKSNDTNAILLGRDVLPESQAMPGVSPKTWLCEVKGSSYDLLRKLQQGNQVRVHPGFTSGVLMVRQASELNAFANKLLHAAMRSTAPGMSQLMGTAHPGPGQVLLMSNATRYSVTTPFARDPNSKLELRYSTFRMPMGCLFVEVANRIGFHGNRLSSMLLCDQFLAALLDRLGQIVRAPAYQLGVFIRRMIFDANALVLDELLHRYQLVSTAQGVEIAPLPFWAIDSHETAQASFRAFGIDTRMTEDENQRFLSESHMRSLGEISWVSPHELFNFSRSARARLDDFLAIYEAKTPANVSDALHTRFNWKP